MLLQASQPHPLSHRQFSKSEADSESGSSNQESRDPAMEVSFTPRQMSPAGPDHNGNAGKPPARKPDFGSEATAAALVAANFPSFPFHLAGNLGSGVAGSALNLTSHLPKTETFDEEEYPSKKDFTAAHLQGKISFKFCWILFRNQG